MMNGKLTLLMLLLFLSMNCFSQENQYSSEQNRPLRYFFENEDKLMLPVNILGLVQKPGQYMVPYQTDLITLIAFAGGFREDAKVSKVKIIRNVATNSKYSTNGKHLKSAKVYAVDIKKYFETGDQRQIPKLMPDDTVVITGSTTRTINKVFDFVGKGILLAQLYFLIKVANN